MRSPIIAFSLFAAVGPALVSAAPQSPKLGNDIMGHSRTTDLKYPQRFAFPRDDPMTGLLGGLTGGGTTASQQPDDSSSQEGIPTTIPSSGTPNTMDPAALSSQPATEVKAAEGETRHYAPTEPKEPDMPRLPNAPDYEPATPLPGRTPITGGDRGSTGSSSGESDTP